MSNIDNLTQHTITDALRQEGIVVIDFWAPWCGPCHAMAPQFERAAQVRSQYRFAKVKRRRAADRRVRLSDSLDPDAVVISDGEVIGAYPGVVGAEQLVGALDRLAPAPEPDPVLQEGAAR